MVNVFQNVHLRVKVKIVEMTVVGGHAENAMLVTSVKMVFAF